MGRIYMPPRQGILKGRVDRCLELDDCLKIKFREAGHVKIDKPGDIFDPTFHPGTYGVNDEIVYKAKSTSNNMDVLFTFKRLDNTEFEVLLAIKKDCEGLCP